MSIPVPLDRLAAEIERRGFGYLVTVGDDQRAHLVALVPVVDDQGRLHLDAGGTSRRNAAARPDVTLVFPPVLHDDFSLVVDGTVAPIADDPAEDPAGDLVVVPTWAVRHRPAPPVER